jgi:hypothetical protein
MKAIILLKTIMHDHALKGKCCPARLSLEVTFIFAMYKRFNRKCSRCKDVLIADDTKFLRTGKD